MATWWRRKQHRFFELFCDSTVSCIARNNLPQKVHNENKDADFLSVATALWFSFLPPATKLGQGYIFTGVCDSVHRGVGVCLSACWDVTPPCPQGQASPREQAPSPAQSAGGTHPTGMQFCFVLPFVIDFKLHLDFSAGYLRDWSLNDNERLRMWRLRRLPRWGRRRH